MKKHNLAGLIFVMPLVILFLVMNVYPILFNLVIGATDWNGIAKSWNFIGLANYEKLLTNPVMPRVIRNFAVFGIATILTQAALGVLLASFFARGVKGAGVYRTVFYVPVIATATIVGNVFSKILETNRGYLNEMLRAVGLNALAQPWLAEPNLALLWIILINIWQWTGYSMLMYYANMLNIPQDTYEAATIDGANPRQQFFRITLPLLRSTHFTLFVLGALGSLKCFDLPYVLTKGGPNYATEFFSTYINKQSFELFDQGMSSAIVVVMLALAMVITLLQLRLYSRKNKDKELADA
ncbi:carbohydrate ABC transporter permease [Bacillota bacterium Meth-B3]